MSREIKNRTRAIFLDRDGTINKEVDLLTDTRQLRLIPGTAKAIRLLKRLGFLVVIVTNQPVIARGEVTEKYMDHIHAVLVRRLEVRGAVIDAIYYCPHHPDASIKKYKIKCRCRKPNTGMITAAAKQFGIQLKNSFMVGDRTADILAGRRAGITTILVGTGYGGADGKHNVAPDFRAKDLGDAVKVIRKYGK